MKDFFKSTRVKAFLVVVLVLFLLAVFTRNSNTSVLSSAINSATYGLSKVSAAAVNDNQKKSYEELLLENEELKKENEDLRAQVVDYYNTKIENTRLWKFYDLKKENTDYTIIPSKVLKEDTNRDYYSFVIDKGSSSKVNVNDPVVCEDGLVGRISEVDANTARVTTILSPQTTVACIDPRNQDFGLVTGSSKYYAKKQAVFTKLKATHKVQNGDIITTTGISGMYPKDIIVGKVVENGFDKYDSSFYAVIEPFFDIDKLSDVAVITDFDFQGEILLEADGD